MKVKHFSLRLSKENLQADEDKMNDFMQTVFIKKTAAQLITAGGINYWSVLIFYDDNITSEHPAKTGKSVPPDLSSLNEKEKARYEALRQWRRNVAREQALPDYMFASNAELAAIAILNPILKQDLYKVKGMGDKKISKYGNEIIDLLDAMRLNEE